MDLTVVIPVFNAADALAECLRSVALYTEPEQSILIIDDGSTDPRVDDLIGGFADRPSRRWIKEWTNRGFVVTANLGFDLCSGHVLLLNSDTVVTQGWLECMRRCLESDPAIATVTPFSNNAEICSLPRFVVNNPAPPDPDAIARALHRCSEPGYPELPTAVGFCMLIRRAALDTLGGFDAQAFGRGYGEENDFCRRAHQAGMRNVLCDDAYVVHSGGASFAATGERPGPETMARLLAKHPDYESLVGRFIAEDPLAERRREIVDYCERNAIDF